MAEQTKQALKVENNTNFPNNNTGFITPALLREFNTDMIDSTVNQITYTADSASFDSRLDSVSSVATGSLLVTASAAGNTITFTKGDGSTFNVTTAGGGGDVTALNAYTASNDSWWAALNPKTGSYAVTGSNVSFTSVTASFKGDGSGLTNVTASFTGVPISNDGIPQGTAGTLNFTGSAVNASVVGGIALITVDSIGTSSFNAFTQSVDNRLDSLEAATSSYANSASVAAVDAAQQAQINALIATSGSADNSALNAFTASIAGTNAFTASTILEINSIEAFTSSVAGTNAFTASIRGTNAFTASIAGTNAFTQSTNATIATINNSLTAINGFTASNSTYEINQWTGSINAFTASIKNTNTFTASAQLEINALEAFTASVAGTNAFTQSAQNSLNSLNAATSSYARTNVDNRFTASQTITGSLVVTGDITANKLFVIIESSSVIYSSGSNQFGDELTDTQILSGSVRVVGGLTVNGLNVVTGAVDTTALNQATASLQAFTASVAGTNAFTQSANQRLNSIEAQSGSWVTSAITASSVVSMSVTPIANELKYTLGNGTTQTFVLNISQPDISALNAFTASVAGTNTFTASAQQSINALNGATASYAISSSVAAVDSAQQAQINALIAFTGSVVGTDLTALNNFTASVFGTNAFTQSAKLEINALEAFTASIANTNTFTQSAQLEINALEAFTASIAGTNAFTASAQNSLNSLNAATSSYITSAVTASMSVATASFAATASLARNVVVTGTNANQSTLPIGTVVRITGANGDNPQFNSASWDNDGTSANTLGVLRSSTASGATGEITTIGVVVGIDTDGMNAGDVLYLGPNGTFTNVQPQAPLHIVTLGEVLRVQQNNGSMFVNISNGWELNELHNVRITSAAQGDFLVYEASSSLWKNQSSSSFAKTNQANTFNADQIVSGSLAVTGNLNVFGSASFTTVTSSVYIGGNRILLNTFTPSVRYGGMEVIDSGSTGLTGSLLWDSQNDVWIYVNPSGSSYASARLISGPKSLTLGSEPTLTQNRVPKADDGDHIVDSQISDDGTTVTITNAISASTFVGLGNLSLYSASVDSRLNNVPAITASSLVTASATLNTITFTKGDNTTFAVTVNTGSAGTASFPYTGSAIISGSLGVTGSISVVSSSFSGAVITNLTDIYTDVAAVQQIVTLTSASYAALASGSATNPNTLYIVSGSTSGTGTDITALNAFTASIAGTNAFTASTLLRLNSIESVTGSFATTGSNRFVGDQTITGSLILSSSAAIELGVVGNSVFSGSVQGRVIAATITSNTASLDFSQGNFFTLALAATVGTHISASNVQPGETVSIRITQNATPGTVTYPPAMKFPSGSAYTASTTANAIDVITFISFDNSTVLASSVKNMI